VGLILSGRAFGQTTSDLPSTNTAPEGATAPPYVPGMTLPRPPTGQSEGPPAKAGASAASGGLFLYESPSVGYVGEPGPKEGIPETHVVRKGDTLWEISAYYFRNAWDWPKLWSYNPSITNPHWIYPGDLVRLRPEQEEVTPVVAPPEAAPTAKKKAPLRSSGIFLRQTGFVEPQELKVAGTIVGSKEEKIMLGTLDEAYVSFKSERPFHVGERYTIYQPMNEVRHPTTGKKLGQIVQIFGEAEVRLVTKGNIARCAIVDSTDPIERGFRVGPLRRQFKVVEPKALHDDFEGQVVAILRPSEMISADEIVFLDRGQKDGVEVGNRFFVTRRGDGYLPLLSRGPIDDKRYPRENIAEVLVVDLRDRLATGLVLKSVKETRVGDRVEGRRGY
jgi:hypothetical protein